MRTLMVVCLAATMIPVAAFAGDDMMMTGYVDGEFQALEANNLAGDTEWSNSFGNSSEAVFWVTCATASWLAVIRPAFASSSGRLSKI